MNLVLEKRERITAGGKGRGEIRNEMGKITGMVADVPTTDSLGNMYRAFDEYVMAAGEVEVFLLKFDLVRTSTHRTF